jgi:hypothetical protein
MSRTFPDAFAIRREIPGPASSLEISLIISDVFDHSLDCEFITKGKISKKKV